MKVLAEIRGALSGIVLIGLGVLALVHIDLGIPGQALLESLRIHIAVALIGLALVIVIVGARLRGAVTILLVVLSLAEVWSMYSEQMAARESLALGETRTEISVLSFNILAENRRGDEIADYILGSSADVVIIMEAGPLFPHFQRLSAIYPHVLGCNDANACDVVILSQTALENTSVGRLGHIWPRRLVRAETQIDGHTVTVVGAHLSKPYFDSAGEFEARRLGNVMAGIEGAVVLAGDFNAAPWSDAMHEMIVAGGLVPPQAYRATWPIALGPLGLPIDNIFTRGPALIERLERVPDSLGSNHYGLLAQIRLVDAP